MTSKIINNKKGKETRWVKIGQAQDGKTYLIVSVIFAKSITNENFAGLKNKV
jgi:hypothetical protein